MARQTTLNVSLTATLRDYVQSRIDSGRYESASEVIRDGLRALQEREQSGGAFWGEVRRRVAVARREVAQGQTVDGEAAMDRIIAELQPPAAKSRRPKKAGR